jgi:hypothetical protein
VRLYVEEAVVALARNCRRQLTCYPARSLSTARIWSISCSKLVQLAKTLDNDYETLQRRVELAPLRRPAGLETAATLAKLRAAVAG